MRAAPLIVGSLPRSLAGSLPRSLVYVSCLTPQESASHLCRDYTTPKGPGFG
jgi:hypothetical protein